VIEWVLPAWAVVGVIAAVPVAKWISRRRHRRETQARMVLKIATDIPWRLHQIFPDEHWSDCQLDRDHTGRCHTADCGYSRDHEGPCWYQPQYAINA
jgi:hypothetical protein